VGAQWVRSTARATCDNRLAGRMTLVGPPLLFVSANKDVEKQVEKDGLKKEPQELAAC